MCGADLSHLDEEAEGAPESEERRSRKAGRDRDGDTPQSNRFK